MAHRYKIIPGAAYPYLVTCTIVRWLPVFVSGPYFRVITDSLQHLRDNRGLAVHAYVIMPTHFHAILSAERDDLPEIMRDFKKFTSRAIYATAEQENNVLLTWMFQRAAKDEPRSRFKVWQDEYHPKAITSLDVFRQKAEYAHNNPVRKGLVADAEDYYYSSARDYCGGNASLLGVDVPDW
ncbi:MAG: REP-associated tyrosine transposase [Armatimonadota bacterium]